MLCGINVNQFENKLLVFKMLRVSHSLNDYQRQWKLNSSTQLLCLIKCPHFKFVDILFRHCHWATLKNLFSCSVSMQSNIIFQNHVLFHCCSVVMSSLYIAAFHRWRLIFCKTFCFITLIYNNFGLLIEEYICRAFHFLTGLSPYPFISHWTLMLYQWLANLCTLVQ